MGIYKFLDKKYVSSLLSGNFCFGRLQYYQLLESIYNDRHKGDRWEGRAETVITGISTNLQNIEPDIIKRIEETRFLKIDNKSSNVHLELQDNIIISQVDAFVFCIAIGDVDSLAEEMNKDGRFGYNGCVEICCSLEDIAKAIWNTGIIDIGTEKKKVSDVFIKHDCDEVTYKKNDPIDIRNSSMIHGDPFIKNDDYSYQSESRIVLQQKPNHPILTDHINIQISLPSNSLLERSIKEPFSLPRKEILDTRSIPELATALKEIVTNMQGYNSVDFYTLSLSRSFNNPQDKSDYFSQEIERRSAKLMEMYKTHYRQEIIELYWLLRCKGKEFQDDAIDKFLVDPVNGGAITGFLYDASRYTNSLLNRVCE